jgi:hypothetical protein
MKRFQLALSALFLSALVIGCGGGTEEIAAGGGGESTASQEEIQKQIEESMRQSRNAYGGSAPNMGQVPGGGN